jgi:hypothetical protein
MARSADILQPYKNTQQIQRGNARMLLLRSLAMLTNAYLDTFAKPAFAAPLRCRRSQLPC